MGKNNLRARDALRAWRRNQTPRVSLDELGETIGKTGSLIGMFEGGRTTLILGDCVALHRITGIPLCDFLPHQQRRLITQAAELLDSVA